MARKPLIEQGSFLGNTATASPPPSIMDNIIARDREKGGRGTATLEQETNTPNITGNITSNITSQITDNLPAHIHEQESAQEDPKLPAQSATQARSKEEGVVARRASAPLNAPPPPDAPPNAGLSATVLRAQKKARRMAGSTAIPITLRAPEDLNDWLDHIAHTHKKLGVKKQALIALALQNLYVLVEGEGADVAALLGLRRPDEDDSDEEDL